MAYNIHPHDIWNFDETGYRIDMARGDWIVTVDPTRTIYSEYTRGPTGVSIEVHSWRGCGSSIRSFDGTTTGRHGYGR